MTKQTVQTVAEQQILTAILKYTYSATQCRTNLTSTKLEKIEYSHLKLLTASKTLKQNNSVLAAIIHRKSVNTGLKQNQKY